MTKTVSSWSKPLTILTFLALTVRWAQADVTPSVVVYPAPAGVALNDTFSVSVRPPGGEWHPLDVYDVRVDVNTLSHASFAYFDFSGQVEVQVTHNKVHVQEVAIRPNSYQIHSQKTKQPADTFTFTLDRPRNLSVEVNGDRYHNLHLFANPLETNVPSPADTNVIYFGPGLAANRRIIHVASGQTVYLAGGAVVQGVIDTAKGATNVTIRGRGVLDMSPWNDAKGHFVVKGQDWQSSAINLNYVTNVLVEGIILKQHVDFAIKGGNVDNAVIDNLKSFSSQEWGDGIDMKSSRHVTIRNCFLRTSDDCVAVYGSRGGFHGSASDWDVSDSVLWADKAHPIMVGVHGAYQKDGDVVEHLRFHNLDVLESFEASPGYWGTLFINCGDKNTVRDVSFEDIRVEHIREAGGYLFRVGFGYFEPSTVIGREIDDIRFKNITYTGLAGSFVGGTPGHPVNGVTFDNVIINGEHILDARSGRIRIGENVNGISFK